MNRLRIPVAVVVTVLWSAVYTKKFLDPSYPAPAEISGVMLAVASWLFASDIRSRIHKATAPKKEEQQ